jgi:hypothetical protein
MSKLPPINLNRPGCTIIRNRMPGVRSEIQEELMTKIQDRKTKAPNKVSVSPRRPGHPVPGLIGPWLQFDLAAEAEKLLQADTWETRSRNAKTLARPIHEASTAEADPGTSTALRSVGLLVVRQQPMISRSEQLCGVR